MRHFAFIIALYLGFVTAAVSADSASTTQAGAGAVAEQVVNLDGDGPGRVFDGIGGLSAGASSRLLIDYPEPQRSQILDFLFKPNFGAALQVLKVEIGGAVYSTWGSEPCHANTRREFEHPTPECYQRGYEWWLMEEARKRNPEIIVESLAWGIPGWIGNPSQDNNAQYLTADTAEYTARFIKAARDYHGVKIDFQGIHNEAPYTVAWIKMLRKALDDRGLQDVKIVAADGVGAGGWNIVRDINADPELSRAVYAVGVHYPGYVSSDDAKRLGKPLWCSEDAILGVSPWARAFGFVKLYNRNYIVGRMTKTVICSLITCNYENLAAWNIPTTADGGITRANTPWSGHYEVSPSLWATAHTTQFTKPGWRYLDAGCGLLGKTGSYVALRSPDKKGDYSIVIETMKGGDYALVVAPNDGEAPDIPTQRLKFNVKNLSPGPVHVWRTNKGEQFVQLPDITPENNAFEISLDVNSIYTLTTTTGQHKGTCKIPEDLAFPLPYKEGFEGYAVNATPRFISDQEGTFAVTRREDGQGKCLRQIIPERGVEWSGLFAYPWTILGDANWKDYEVSADVRVAKGFAAVYGRIDEALSRPMPGGYGLFLDPSGQWQLKDTTNVLHSGQLAGESGAWHNLKLVFSGPHVGALIDGKTVCELGDDFHPQGAVGLASSYDDVEFDNLLVARFAGPATKPVSGGENLALHAKAVASSQLNDGCDAAKAIDGNHKTGWCPAAGKTAGEWLELDFGKEITFDRTVIDQHKLDQYAASITAYKIQYGQAGDWRDAIAGKSMGIRQADAFPPVTARKVRLLITACGDKSCVFELQVYRQDQANRDGARGETR